MSAHSHVGVSHAPSHAHISSHPHFSVTQPHAHVESSHHFSTVSHAPTRPHVHAAGLADKDDRHAYSHSSTSHSTSHSAVVASREQPVAGAGAVAAGPEHHHETLGEHLVDGAVAMGYALSTSAHALADAGRAVGHALVDAGHAISDSFSGEGGDESSAAPPISSHHPSASVSPLGVSQPATAQGGREVCGCKDRTLAIISITCAVVAAIAVGVIYAPFSNRNPPR